MDKLLDRTKCRCPILSCQEFNCGGCPSSKKDLPPCQPFACVNLNLPNLNLPLYQLDRQLDHWDLLFSRAGASDVAGRQIFVGTQIATAVEILTGEDRPLKLGYVQQLVHLLFYISTSSMFTLIFLRSNFKKSWNTFSQR